MFFIVLLFKFLTFVKCISSSVALLGERAGKIQGFGSLVLDCIAMMLFILTGLDVFWHWISLSMEI